MKLGDFLTSAGPWIAIYAAILSTINALIALTNFFRDRRDVRISFGRETQVDERGNEGDTFTRVIVANAGRRPVTIVDLYALCLHPKGEHIILSCKRELPEELKEH
jgi:hypothetical protein